MMLVRFQVLQNSDGRMAANGNLKYVEMSDYDMF